MIDAAAFNDHAGLAALLTEAELPLPDARDSPVYMRVARDGSAVLGCIGWERFGAAALLRSLAIRGDARGHGLGRALVTALLGELRSLGVGDVYLLTTGAADFFARLGFRSIKRAAVPKDVRASQQFGGDSCCATAACMHLALPPAPV